MPLPIYLDNHASTPPDPRVREAMLPWLGDRFGNPGSRSHAYGWSADAAVTQARESLAALVGGEPGEIVFTSGATEAIHLALLGVAALHEGGRIVTCAIEHHAVLDTCAHLARRGFEVVVLPVDRDGLVDAAAVVEAAAEGTILVSVMAANNEIGTIQPVAEIGRACRERGIAFHCDAAQAVGRIPVDADAWSVDLLSLSAHKFHGPQGVGALFARTRPPRARLAPVMFGGGQERGLRPGTLNVPGIVGLGAAAAAAREDLARDVERIGGLRDRLERELAARAGALHVHGHPQRRLPGNLSVRFDGVEAEDLLLAMPGIAVSTGSACASGAPTASHVLRGIGLSDAEARGVVRFGLGRFTTDAEIDQAIEATVQAVARLRRG